MINVIIADDHTIVRDGVRQIINIEPDLIIIGEAQNGNEVLEMVRRSQVDVVVLDITMPGRNGIETLKDLRRNYPEIAVIVLSMHPKDQYALRVLKSGAAGYVTKENAHETLVDAIRKAYRGEKYISPGVAKLLADYVEHGDSTEPLKRLSDREFEVFCHLASGKRLSEVSAEMNLSVKTISTYRSRILEKTLLSSNSELTRYAIERSLI